MKKILLLVIILTTIVMSGCDTKKDVLDVGVCAMVEPDDNEVIIIKDNNDLIIERLSCTYYDNNALELSNYTLYENESYKLSHLTIYYENGSVQTETIEHYVDGENDITISRSYNSEDDTFSVYYEERYDQLHSIIESQYRYLETDVPESLMDRMNQIIENGTLN